MTDGPAVQHWHEIVEARRVQMDAAYAALRRSSSDFWTRRAGSFRRYAGVATDDHRLVSRVQALLPQNGSVLDVGAGTGRYALALARTARRVVALEPSHEMADILRDDAHSHEFENVEVVEAGWPDASASTEAADVVLCANVLYPHAGIEAWIRSLEQKAVVAVVVEMMVDWAEPPVLLNLWQRFHGASRVLQPDYFDLYAVLHEMGVRANVEIYPAGTSRFWHFDTMDAAVDAVREHVLLPSGDEIDVVLRAELAANLVEDGGALTLTSERSAAAIWWAGSARSGDSCASA